MTLRGTSFAVVDPNHPITINPSDTLSLCRKYYGIMPLRRYPPELRPLVHLIDRGPYFIRKRLSGLPVVDKVGDRVLTHNP